MKLSLRAFVLPFLALSNCLGHAEVPRYRIAEVLPSQIGGKPFVPHVVGSQRQVLGTLPTKISSLWPESPRLHLFSAGRTELVSTGSDFYLSEFDGLKLNGRGTIAGTEFDFSSSGVPQQNGYGFIVQNGVGRRVGQPGSWVYGLNENDMVLGANPEDGAANAGIDSRPFRYRNGSLEPLMGFGAVGSSLNNLGVVAGSVHGKAAFWPAESSEPQFLSLPWAAESSGIAQINDRGDMGGYVWWSEPGSGSRRMYLWTRVNGQFNLLSEPVGNHPVRSSWFGALTESGTFFHGVSRTTEDPSRSQNATYLSVPGSSAFFQEILEDSSNASLNRLISVDKPTGLALASLSNVGYAILEPTPVPELGSLVALLPALLVLRKRRR